MNRDISTIYCEIPPALLRRSFQQKFGGVAAKPELPPRVLQRSVQSAFLGTFVADLRETACTIGMILKYKSKDGVTIYYYHQIPDYSLQCTSTKVCNKNPEGARKRFQITTLEQRALRAPTFWELRGGFAFLQLGRRRFFWGATCRLL